MSPLPLFPYLLGLIPIALARTWPARIVAIAFGTVSLILGIRYIEALHQPGDSLSIVESITPVVYQAFGIAVLSLAVTYFVDRSYAKRR